MGIGAGGAAVVGGEIAADAAATAAAGAAAEAGAAGGAALLAGEGAAYAGAADVASATTLGSFLPSAGTMAAISTGTSLLGTVASAVGARQQSTAQQSSALFQQQVLLNNQQTAKQNAALSAEAGTAAANIEGMKNRAVIGATKASQAASGIDVNSGSAVDVRSSADELGQLNALTVRSNAAKQSYGYEVQASNFGSQAQISGLEAENAATAGTINVASSILGGASSAGKNYALWQMSGGGNSVPALWG